MGEYIIEVENLVHTYHGACPALDGINLKFKRGEFTAVIGQNGAGKTTLLKHLNGLLRPSRGQVLINGLDTAREKVSYLARYIGLVFQNPDHQIFHDRVDKEVAFGPLNLGLSKQETAARVEKALEAVGLAEYAKVSPQELSKGQRQRVALASVLAMQTDIIVLDEPTTGQDYKEALQIMDMVKGLNDQGHTILFITHDMSLVAGYAHRVIALCKGKVILDGAPEEVFSKVEDLGKTFIHPPQIRQLASALGMGPNILTPDRFLAELSLTIGGAAGGSFDRVSSG